MKTTQPKSILFISAHPDDETVSTGTFLRARSNGWNNYIYHLTPGKNGKPNSGESVDTVLHNRNSEAERFAELVGGTATFYDNGKTFLSYDDEAIISLVQFIRNTRPNVIILLHEGDYHFEHIVSRQIALTAIEIAARSCMLEFGPKITDFIILDTDGLCALARVDITIDTSIVQAEKEQAIAESYGARLGSYLQNYDRGLSQMRGERLGYSFGESYALVLPPWYQLSISKAVILQEFIALSQYEVITHNS